MGKSKKKKKQKQMTILLTLVIVAILVVSMFGLYLAGFFIQAQVTHNVMDTRFESLVETFGTGGLFIVAQSFVAPSNIDGLKRVDIRGLNIFAGSTLDIGFSEVLSYDIQDWLWQTDFDGNPVGARAMRFTGPLIGEATWDGYWDVTPGQTYYLIAKVYGQGMKKPGEISLVGNKYNAGMAYTKTLIGDFQPRSDRDMCARIQGLQFTQPPPTPQKPTSSHDYPLTNQMITFSTKAVTDPQGSIVRYQFDFGDGTTSSWNTLTSAQKTYANPGIYDVKVRARNMWNDESPWSSPLQITVHGQPPVPDKYSVTIKVFDSSDYSTVSGATVICGGITRTTGIDGIASFELEDGYYIAQVSKSGYTSGSVSFTVSGSSVARSVYLTPTYEPPPPGDPPDPPPPGDPPDPPPEPGMYDLTVEVYDYDTFDPVAGAETRLNGLSKITDAKGSTVYSLEGSGKVYTIQVSKPGFADSERTVTLYQSDLTVTVYLYKDAVDPTPPPPTPPPDPDETPGFELLSLLVACGVAVILLKRRKQMKR